MVKNLFATVLIVAMLAAGSAKADLVVNGGFETRDFTGWTQSGDTGFTRVGNINVHSGSFSAEAGPDTSLGFLSQTLSTTLGTNYTISFWLENGDNIFNNEFDVEWNSTTLSDQTNLPFAEEFTHYTFNVTGTGSDTLTFSFFNFDNFFFLDDVSVNSTALVPEPSSMALLVSGILGLGWVMRRRRTC
jgi:hypothetical protein